MDTSKKQEKCPVTERLSCFLPMARNPATMEPDRIKSIL